MNKKAALVIICGGRLGFSMIESVFISFMLLLLFLYVPIIMTTMVFSAKALEHGRC